MEAGDILGHEFMGEVVEVGSGVKNLKVGDRVVVPFDIGCGNCFFCTHGLWSACDNSNPNADLAEKFYGYTTAGLYGYSHITGGYAGGQAEYVRIAYADTNAYVVPDGLPDEKVLFLTDIFPTGYMAAENCNIQPGYGIAGLFAYLCAGILADADDMAGCAHFHKAAIIWFPVKRGRYGHAALPEHSGYIERYFHIRSIDIFYFLDDRIE
jgi:threonine dehydrogenase-like Zn-dependent dehydrogenase